MKCHFCEASLSPGQKTCPHCRASVPAAVTSKTDRDLRHPLLRPVSPWTNKLSIASLVASILSWLTLIVLVVEIHEKLSRPPAWFVVLPIGVAITAVVMGHLALAVIHTQAGLLAGNGFAVAGLILGYLHLALWGLLLLAVLFLVLVFRAVSVGP
jgi:hypothetical protein